MLRRILSLVLCSSLVAAPLTALPDTREVLVVADLVNVRAEPSTKARVLYQARRGEALHVSEDAGEWYLVTASGRPSGYVSKSMVEAAAPVVAPAFTEPAAALPAAAAPPGPSVAHTPLACMRCEDNPLVLADVTSPAQVQKSRVYFKAHQHPDWYYIDMKSPEVPHYATFLPQPLAETQQVDYYVQVLDAMLQTARTDQFEPMVSKTGCHVQLAPAAIRVDRREAQQIVVGGTKEGQAPIPPGFSKKGIIGFVAVTGVLLAGAALAGGGTAAAAGGAAAGAGGAAGTGGGISGTTIGVVAGGVGVAAVVVVATRGGKAQYAIAGTSTSSATFFVDDRLIVSVEGLAPQTIEGCLPSGCQMVGPIAFEAKPGQQLSIQAIDRGGPRFALEAIKLYKDGSPVLNLSPGIECTSAACGVTNARFGDTERVFFSQSYQLP